LALWAAAVSARGAFQLDLHLENPNNEFSAVQVQLLNDALVRAEKVWNTVIAGYRPGITLGPVDVGIYPTGEGLAFGSPATTSVQGGFTLTVTGSILVNVNEVENFANWQGPGANGLNFLDELLVHEAGHVLGLGSLWTHNNVYVPGTFQYTGAYGLAAYQSEFDAAAAFVPVENAGSAGTAGAHWDQRMRSSETEGNPANPWLLDPRVGVVDSYGRDRGLEVLTGAIDPDYGEPFLSRFTVESMRDLGYTVTAFEDFDGDGAVSGADLAVWASAFGATGLQMDSLAMGDADRDRAVAGRDFLLWQRAFGGGGAATNVAEPVAAVLAACVALASGGLVRGFGRAGVARIRLSRTRGTRLGEHLSRRFLGRKGPIFQAPVL
jgi:hypothetical protein